MIKIITEEFSNTRSSLKKGVFLIPIHYDREIVYIKNAGAEYLYTKKGNKSGEYIVSRDVFTYLILEGAFKIGTESEVAKFLLRGGK